MKILVIEDGNNKFNRIFNTLNGISNDCEIIRTKSRNSGLFKIFESIKTNERFDLIICDNYLPLLDDEIDIYPFANEIIELIRNKDETTPICVISSEEIEDCDCDYYIKYYPYIDLDIYLKNILDDIKKRELINSKVNKIKIKKKDINYGKN